ncbi:MAG: hypothetical protein AAFP84_13950 [Actinomycetota bacterium]
MRSAVAEQHGLDDDLVAELDRPDPDLTDEQRTAVDFATALISDPAGIDGELRQRLRSQFTDAQIVELALDTMKWSYQKVAVALGVDRPIVDGALTPLAFDDDGNWIRHT